MSSGGGPARSLGRLATTLLLLAIAGQLLVGLLPRLVGPAIVIASVVITMRIAWRLLDRY